MENFYKNMEPIDLILALLKILDVKTIQEYSSPTETLPF